MKLTKKKAIEEHRKMWNWIADQLENGISRDIYELKYVYLKENGYDPDDVLHYCFCCQYTTNDDLVNCDYCPLAWGTEDEVDEFFCETYPETSDSFKNSWVYARILALSGKCKQAAAIARNIANLAERPDEEFDIYKEE